MGKERGEDLAARIIAALGEAGFEVQGSYMPIHLLTHITQCVWDRLPYSDLVWPDLIELPCEPSVAFEDLEQYDRDRKINSRRPRRRVASFATRRLSVSQAFTSRVPICSVL